jgi:hypothetical protein
MPKEKRSKQPSILIKLHYIETSLYLKNEYLAEQAIKSTSKIPFKI